MHSDNAPAFQLLHVEPVAMKGVVRAPAGGVPPWTAVILQLDWGWKDAQNDYNWVIWAWNRNIENIQNCYSTLPPTAETYASDMREIQSPSTSKEDASVFFLYDTSTPKFIRHGRMAMESFAAHLAVGLAISRPKDYCNIAKYKKNRLRVVEWIFEALSSWILAIYRIVVDRLLDYAPC